MVAHSTLREKPLGDGRLARTIRTRGRIVDAMLSLVLEGHANASLIEIAARAEVTERTLFNHFPDISVAIAAALARSREMSQRLMPEVADHADPVVGVLAWFDAAAPFYELYSATRWAALVARRPVPGFDARQGKGLVLSRLEARVFELCGGIDPTLRADARRRAALLTLIDPLAWRLLRVQQGLSPKKASQAMACGVLAVCGEHSAAAPARRKSRGTR